MGFLEVSFVLIMLLAGVYVTIIVRRDINDREEGEREVQRRLELERRQGTSAPRRGHGVAPERRP